MKQTVFNYILIIGSFLFLYRPKFCAQEPFRFPFRGHSFTGGLLENCGFVTQKRQLIACLHLPRKILFEDDLKFIAIITETTVVTIFLKYGAMILF